MIDWSLAKKGATVVFRNGDSDVVVDYFNKDYNEHTVFFKEGVVLFNEVGMIGFLRSPFDIISIEPAPEPKKIVGYVPLLKNGQYIDFGELSSKYPIHFNGEFLEITWIEGETPTIRSVKC